MGIPFQKMSLEQLYLLRNLTVDSLLLSFHFFHLPTRVLLRRLEILNQALQLRPRTHELVDFSREAMLRKREGRHLVRRLLDLVLETLDVLLTHAR